MPSEVAAADAEARRQALDPAGSFLVQAPAGSGKTELLIQRYLTLLAAVEAPEEVVAITFTRKAAGEMRGRVLKALAAAGGQAPAAPHEQLTWTLARAALARDAERGWAVLDQPSRLRILTIDALCGALARQMPVLARFGAPPGVAEDAAPLYRAAARETLAQLEAGERWSPAIEQLLAHLDNHLGVVEALLAAMLGRRDQWLRHLGAGTPVRAELEAALSRLVCEALAELRAAVPVALAEEVVALARYAGANLQAEGREHRLASCAELTGLPGVEPDQADAWRALAELLLTAEGNWRRQVNKGQGFPAPGSAPTPADKQRCEAMKQRHAALVNALRGEPGLAERLHAVRSLLPPRYEDAQWQVLAALCELLPLAVAQLQLVFAARGQVDFTEVALAALRALGAPEAPTDLALALDYRLRHLLIDEFQDTSLSQYELLERLTAGWQPGDGRTLFLVGDPMQSIYRFRDAEVGLYLRARREGIGQLRLTPLTLTVNFRSQQGIVDWVNQAFAAVLPERESVALGAVSYAPAIAHHAAEPGEAVSVHPFLGGASAAQEAARVAALITEARARDPQGTVAVLVRSRSHLAEIVPRLRAAGLRYRAVEIEHLGHRPAVQDLLALTRALAHPADRTAWLGVLRAPWCGLTLADLHALCADAPRAALWDLMGDARRAAALSAEGRARLAAVRGVLAAALCERGRLPLRRWVEGTWLALHGPATLSDPTDLEDAEVFLALLEALEAEGGPFEPGVLDERMAKLFALPDVHADERLQIMTMHKAKGLQFDTVIVPGLGRRPAGNEARLLVWMERPVGHDKSDLLLAPIRAAGSAEDPIYAYLQGLDRAKGRYEDGRLLYVAATRARRRLHLLGHANVSVREDERHLVAPPDATLLARLWPVVAPVYEAALAQWVPEPAEPETPASAAAPRIARLPATWQAPAAPGAVSWAGGEERAPEELPAVEFDWAGETARHVGSVVHAMLQRIAEQGLAGWDAARVDAHRGWCAARLLRLGVPPGELPRAEQRVLEAVGETLADARGRWLLDAHAQARCEWALSGVSGDRVVNVVIDRSFIDEQGVRWIVDYKTGRHEGGALEAFLDREQERYRDQLETYAALVANLEDRPIRLGLYFPLLGGWREWPAR